MKPCVKVRVFLVPVLLLMLLALASAASPEDTGKCLMWEVRSENATAYLLGSLHFCGKDVYPLNDAIEDAYATSDTLVLEMEMTAANQSKAASLMMKEGMYQDAATLSTSISKESLAKLEAFLKSRGMTVPQVDKMKPWPLLMVLSVQEIVRLGYSPDDGIDMHFLALASKSGKPVKGLETPEEQVGILSDSLASIQEKELVEFIDEVADVDRIYKDMAAAWKAGDAAAMNRVIEENMSKDPQVKELSVKLIDERNVRMADRIAGLMKDGKNCFVVVGSGHLVTDKSIPALLKEKGFTVRQVDKKPPQKAPAPEALGSSESLTAVGK